ncbi:MAG: CRTAC1 family protein, partial [Bacteroidota bacterium]
MQKLNTFFICLILLPWNLMAQQFLLAPGAVNSTFSDSRSINFIDFNEDGWIDLFVSNGPEGGQKDLFYLNNGEGLLQSVELGDLTNSALPSDGASFADFNNDGLLDAAVSSWYGAPDLVYLNNGNGQLIKQDNKQLGIAPGSYAETAAFGDYDGDGYLDLYITNNLSSGRNYLYRNLGNGKFEWIKDHILVSATKPSRGAIWLDYNNDGHTDLFVVNEGDYSNELYSGKGNGEFELLNRGSIVIRRVSSMTSSWGDIDNDGDFDAFIGNSGFFTGKENSLYKNFGDSFGEQVDDPTAAGKGCTFGSAFGDYDNDGDLDLVVSNGFCNTNMQNQLFENQGDGSFKEVTELLPANTNICSFGVAWGDVNNDGFLDLMFANCKNNDTDSEKPNRLLMNQGNDNNWLVLHLKGTNSNKSAIGTKVRLKAQIDGKETWQIREIRSQSGYAGQNSPAVHFGMKDAIKADSILIIWPSGLIETFTNVEANQRMFKEEGVATPVSNLVKHFKWKISPNPLSKAASVLSIETISEKAYPNAEAYLLNALGQKVTHFKMPIQPGSQIQEIPISSISLKS